MRYFFIAVFLFLLDTVVSECDPTKLAPDTCPTGQTVFCIDGKQNSKTDSVDTFVPFNLPKDSKCSAGDIPTCCDGKTTALLVKNKKGFTLREKVSGDTGCLAAKKQKTCAPGSDSPKPGSGSPKPTPDTCPTGQTIFCIDGKQNSKTDSVDTFVPFNLPKDSKCNTGDIPTCCDGKTTELLKTKRDSLREKWYQIALAVLLQKSPRRIEWVFC
ncbi:hypothetical protein Pst134EA_032847 [Puccinia striiformis f. sp. tritici]|uniref:uncharacterized protein n=1 Tax=Puccinia striiformis f. sp. tritici TaxID=168172 RepID=UPI0020087983|nr:uncharacterized protein Pst134EA_032847 [Puccinia striiformis f. sp. tritici]KAH9441583.1 hypothetical protein Pst134EA_032847 [Puccinia striiformis f. sp. tritici]